MSKEKLKTEIECSCFDTLLVLELSSLIVAALKLSKGSSNLNIVGEPNKLKKSMEKEHQDTLSSKEKEDQIMQKLRTRRLHYSWASCTGRKQQISNTVGCPDQKDRKREGKEKKKKKKKGFWPFFTRFGIQKLDFEEKRPRASDCSKTLSQKLKIRFCGELKQCR